MLTLQRVVEGMAALSTFRAVGFVLLFLGELVEILLGCFDKCDLAVCHVFPFCNEAQRSIGTIQSTDKQQWEHVVWINVGEQCRVAEGVNDVEIELRLELVEQH
jgi:hypothetical protein